MKEEAQHTFANDGIETDVEHGPLRFQGGPTSRSEGKVLMNSVRVEAYGVTWRT
jgi:hypothetical protein